MEMTITFPGGKKVNAEFDGRTIMTDQPAASGGEGSAPTPFEYFLGSIGTCAGIYALVFCQERNISTEGMNLLQKMEFAEVDGKRRVTKISLEINLPPGFPEKYRNAIVKAAELCTVKKAIFDPPEFSVTALPSEK